MELKDLKVGMKVKIPKTKGVYGPVSRSNVIKKALKNNQDYLYFIKIDKEDGYILLDSEKTSREGDFFLLQDIELYEEEKRTPEKPMYTIKELEERKDLVIYLDSQEEFNKLKTITNNLTNIYCGKHCYSLYERNYSSWSNKTSTGGYDDVNIIKIDQITELNMKEKEIVGYKLIKPEYEEAALLLCIKDGMGWAKNEKYHFSNESIAYQNAIKARILDIWFEPVFFEEEFKIGDWVSFYSEVRSKIITSQIKDWTAHSYCKLKNGSEPFKHLIRKATEEEIAAATHKTVKLSIGKNVDIGRDKLSNQVFIIAEGKTIQYKHINNLYCNTNTFGDTGWKIQYNTFDIGCWKNITREDLKLIIDAYEEIND